MNDETLRIHWREVVGGFLKIGATSYGSPAVMGQLVAAVVGHKLTGVGDVLARPESTSVRTTSTG